MYLKSAKPFFNGSLRNVNIHTHTHTHTHTYIYINTRTHTHMPLSHVWLFANPWTVACQAPRSMELSRQEYWSGLPFLPPEDMYLYVCVYIYMYIYVCVCVCVYKHIYQIKQYDLGKLSKKEKKKKLKASRYLIL